MLSFYLSYSSLILGFKSTWFMEEKGKKLSLLIKEHVVEKKLNILYLFHGQAHEGTNGQEKTCPSSSQTLLQSCREDGPS